MMIALILVLFLVSLISLNRSIRTPTFTMKPMVRSFLIYFRPFFKIILGGTGMYWTEASNSDGAEVAMQPCQGLGTTSQNWVYNNLEGASGVGTIKIFGNKCLDVTNGVDASGTKLQIWTCASGNTNQLWEPTTGDVEINTFKWSGSTRCVDLTGGSQSAGASVSSIIM